MSYIPLLGHNSHQIIEINFPWNNEHNLVLEAHFHVSKFPTVDKSLRQNISHTKFGPTTTYKHMLTVEKGITEKKF